MAKKSKLQSDSIYEMQAEICGALANPVRLKILELLADGEKTSSQLLEILEIPKANMSQHLAVLKDAGILQSRKDGLFQYLSLGLPKIKEACAIVQTILIEKIDLDQARHSELKRELKIQRS